jgi:hypothetical protein
MIEDFFKNIFWRKENKLIIQDYCSIIGHGSKTGFRV